MPSKSQGTIRKRGDGTWGFRVEKGVQPVQVCEACRAAKRRPHRWWLEGKPKPDCPRCGGPLETTKDRRQDEVAGYRTQDEAKDAYLKLQGAVNDGTHVETVDPKQTVREYLERWLQGATVARRRSTVRMYRQHVEDYLIPKLGTIRLRNLSPDHITGMYAELLEDGAVRRPKAKDDDKAKDGAKKAPKASEEKVLRPLSPTTVGHTHAVLHAALVDAVKRGYLPRNPADGAERPKKTKRKMSVWTADEARTFLESTEADRWHPMWAVMLDRGMRREEACGLKWEDVDFDAATISIQRVRATVGYDVDDEETKNLTSTRRIPVSRFTKAALQRQAALQADDAEKWGEAWTDSGFVFTHEDGNPVHPDRVSKVFAKHVTRAKVRRIRLHDLRHTCASLLLKAGIHPKVVQELLGHKTITITLDTYSHLLPGLQEGAAETIGAMLAKPATVKAS